MSTSNKVRLKISKVYLRIKHDKYGPNKDFILYFKGISSNVIPTRQPEIELSRDNVEIKNIYCKIFHQLTSS